MFPKNGNTWFISIIWKNQDYFQILEINSNRKNGIPGPAV